MVHAYAPPKNFLKALWVNHSVHHYKDGEIVFGVSSPLWDYIYGTMKLKAGEENKNSHSDLGVA
jgi:sterol desaturase/sphingolipid hydroxylase (fatty acid hydroxylase superfamily)